MNEESELKLDKAWAWYNPDTGIIKHVTFIENQLHDTDTQQIEMEMQTATDIMLGVSNMSHYKVVKKSGSPVITHIATSLSSIVAIFWSLNECIPFDKKWKAGDEFTSPIRLIRKKNGFGMYVVSHTTNGKVYITLKEDPTWLIKTIDIGTVIATHGLGPIPIVLDTDRNYSIYVRYDAA